MYETIYDRMLTAELISNPVGCPREFSQGDIIAVICFMIIIIFGFWLVWLDRKNVKGYYEWIKEEERERLSEAESIEEINGKYEYDNKKFDSKEEVKKYISNQIDRAVIIGHPQ